jgi:peptidoglycan/xylan/chitin deacetylase (PgdA/CDA1 family)
MLPLSIFSLGVGISQFINIWGHHQVSAPENPPVQSAVTVQLAAQTTESIATSSKRIALTFDDGPYGTSTARILDILESEHVPATFFLIGKNVELHPEQVVREIVDGDVIGNHSYSHSKLLPVMTANKLREDISHGQNVIVKAIGSEAQTMGVPHLFRPPYSRTSPGMIREITSEGYIFAGWNIDPRDWNNSNSPESVITNVLTSAKPDGIVIMHDGHEVGTNYSRANTIAALPIIIESLKKEGYTFVTIDKILGVQPYRTK